MKKAYLSFLLAAVLLASLFTGCNTGSQPQTSSEIPASSGQPATQEPGSSAEPASSDEVVTLFWWNIGDQPYDLAQGLAAMNEYTESQIGIRFDMQQVSWGEWEQKMNTVVNSGEYFDIMFTDLTNYNQIVTLGAFADITELAPSAAPDLWEFIPQEVWNGTKVNGKIYSVPTYKDSSKTGFWVWDDAYVQKYDIDISKIDFPDLDEAFRKMKEGEGRSFYPLQLSQGSLFTCIFDYYDSMSAGLPPIGVRLDDPERKVVSVLEQDDIQEYLTYMHGWYTDGIINPDANVMQEPNKMLPFFYAIGWPGAEALWQVNNGVDKYVIAKRFGPSYTTDSIQGSMNAISANSKYKEEALQLLELANLDHKFRDMLAFGIEGTHFEYESENVIRKLTDTWTMSAYSQASFFHMSTPHDGQADQWDQVKKQNEEAEASYLLGFGLDISGISSEVANCKAVWDKYKYDMLTGASDPAQAIPSCVAELRSNGLETIMEEAQRQIDEYFS